MCKFRLVIFRYKLCNAIVKLFKNRIRRRSTWFNFLEKTFSLGTHFGVHLYNVVAREILWIINLDGCYGISLWLDADTRLEVKEPKFWVITTNCFKDFVKTILGQWRILGKVDFGRESHACIDYTLISYLILNLFTEITRRIWCKFNEFWIWIRWTTYKKVENNLPVLILAGILQTKATLDFTCKEIGVPLHGNDVLYILLIERDSFD